MVGWGMVLSDGKEQNFLSPTEIMLHQSFKFVELLISNVPFFAVAYTQPISVAHAELMFPKLPQMNHINGFIFVKKMGKMQPTLCKWRVQ
jgi:hypothetical protein